MSNKFVFLFAVRALYYFLFVYVFFKFLFLQNLHFSHEKQIGPIRNQTGGLNQN